MHAESIKRESHRHSREVFPEEKSVLDRRRFLIGCAALTSTMVGARQLMGAPVTDRRIDVHHHMLPPPYVKEAPSSAEAMRWNWTPQRSLEEMDKNGIAASMLSLARPLFWISTVESGRRLTRSCNDYAAQLGRDNVGRFGLFGGLPPLGDTEGCLQEIDYLYGPLKADGVTVMTSYGDRYLGDADFAPVWEELDRRHGIVFVHPSDPSCCTAIKDGVRPAYGEWPFDTARTVMSLWSSNSLLRWPNIRFIFSHGGGALPMIADRIDKIGRNIPSAAGGPGEFVHDAISQIRTLYFDTAQAADPTALGATRSLADPKHILFGTDFPYVPAARTVDDLARASLPPRVLRDIESDNAIAIIPRLKT
jgi:predicted TIM-barrel fold metal-dependent hydrolase